MESRGKRWVNSLIIVWTGVVLLLLAFASVLAWLLTANMIPQQLVVSLSAITENKHLSAVLEHIKAEQDKAPPKKRRAGKQRTVYTPTGRRNDGWNTLADRRMKAARAAGQGFDI